MNQTNLPQINPLEPLLGIIDNKYKIHRVILPDGKSTRNE